MKKFRLYWLDGKVEDIEGPTISMALNNFGYGLGAMKALDYWEEIQ